MDVLKLLIIFFVGLGSSFIGTLVGGSSLITIPVLILLGLSPHSAIATDRMGVTGIGIAGLYKFHQKGLVNYRIGLITGIPILRRRLHRGKPRPPDQSIDAEENHCGDHGFGTRPFGRTTEAWS